MKKSRTVKGWTGGGRRGGAARSLFNKQIAAKHARTPAAISESPACGHSACRQNWIDTGETFCVQDT
jgi:hypothetical protein